MNDEPRTPEEARWMASVLDPEKAKRRIKYGYIILAVWTGLSIFWLTDLIRADEPLRWADGLVGLVMLMGIMSGVAGIVSNRRIAKGRRPLKF